MPHLLIALSLLLQGTPFFAADFAVGEAIPSAMMLDGDWALGVDGLLVGEDGASFQVNANWTDFTYHIDFTILEAGSVHLVSRARAENPCQGLHVIFAGDAARLGGVTGAGCEGESTLAITNFQPEGQLSVRVALVGNTIRVFLNDDLLLSGMSSRFPNGGVGLLLRDGARIAISSIAVEASDGAPGLLAAFDSEPDDILAELRAFGLIPDSGRMLFEENRVFVRGGGYNVIPLAQNSPRVNVVLGGELHFRRGATSDPEACIIVARADSNIETGMSLRFMDSGALMFADQPDVETGGFAVRSLSLDLSEPHTILMILNGAQMTVYVDGQLIFEALPVVERPGIFALAGRGKGLGFRCDIFDMWVYDFDVHQ